MKMQKFFSAAPGCSILLLALAFLFPASLAGANTSTIPDTGIVRCYDGSGAQIICPSSGASFYGQDGQTGLGVMNYLNHGNGTVTDTVSGFTWEIKGSKDGIQNTANPNDADNKYTWDDAQQFISALNNANFGNRSNWRLPTAKELSTILDLSASAPAPTVNASIFINTQTADYWTSNENIDNPGQAWAVDFADATNSTQNKGTTNYVRAISGNILDASSFIDNNNDTITDNRTSLVWQKVVTQNGTWQNALSTANSQNIAGLCWRLPNRKELESLVDRNNTISALDSYFTLPAGPYWSASPVAGTATAWTVDLDSGLAAPAAATGTNNILAVADTCGVNAADLTPPAILLTTPAEGTYGVSISTTITVQFSEALDPASVTGSNIYVAKISASGASTAVSGSVSYDAASSTATFSPTGGTLPTDAVRFIITVKGNASGIKDLAGNGMSADFVSRFYTTDTTPPTNGSIVIKGGATTTNSREVCLSLAASDNSGEIAQMIICNDPAFPSACIWEPFSVGRSWTLPAGYGEKTVYAKFKDGSGNESDRYSDSILLNEDQSQPGVTISSHDTVINGADLPFTISGTATEKVTVSATTTAGGTVTCEPALGQAPGTAWKCTLANLSDGSYPVTVTATDEAGNTTTVTSAPISYDNTIPVLSSLSINEGTITNSTTVHLTLAASDNLTGITEMQFSLDNGTSWSTWEPYATGKALFLGHDGSIYNVLARVRDAAGNISLSQEDSITLDITEPALTINDPNRLTGSSTLSPVLSGTIETGSTLTAEASPTATISCLTAGGTWSCSVGNLSPGTTTLTITARDQATNARSLPATITYDNVPPSGSLQINNDAAITNNANATLTLSATDASTVTGVLLKNENESWAAAETRGWQTYQTTKAWTLSSNSGTGAETKTVSVKFKDAAGNISPEYSDTISLDNRPPLVSNLTLNPGPASGTTRLSAQTLNGMRSDTDATIYLAIAGGTAAWIGTPTYSGTSWSAPVVLAEGLNTITASALDPANNRSDNVSVSITMDTTAAVTIASITRLTGTATQIISGTRDADASLVVKVNGTPVTACNPIAAGSTTWSCNLPLTPGDNTIGITATDSLGNTNTITDSITYNDQAPTGTITINSGADKTRSRSVVVTLEPNAGITVTEFRLSNDRTSWDSWRSFTAQKNWSLASGGDGPRTVYAEFKDAAGSTNFTTISDTITLDTTGPDVNFNPVTTPTGGTTQAISGTMEQGATVTINISAGLVQTVSYNSDKTQWFATVNLNSGWNFITAMAEDPLGNKTSKSTRIYRDTQADVHITKYTTPASADSQKISGTMEAGGSVTITVAPAGTTCTVTYPSATSWECTITGLTAGTNTVTAAATDSYGNPGSTSVTISRDIVPPTASLVINNGDSITGGTLLVSLTVTDLSAGDITYVRFSNDGSSWSGWYPYPQGAPSGTFNWYLSSGSGTKTVYGQAKDPAGNISATFSDSISLDTQGPVVTINQTITSTKNTTVTLPVTCSKSGELCASLSITNGSCTQGSGFDWTCNTTLADQQGNQYITVTGTDALNNNTKVSTWITYDTIGEVRINTITSPTNQASRNISGWRESGATITSFFMNGENKTSQVVLTGSTGWYVPVTLAEGNNTFSVTATDPLGNVSPAAETSAVLDSIKPVLTIDDITPNPRTEAALTITGTMSSDATLTISSGAAVNSISPDYPSAGLWQAQLTLAEGTNSIRVYAKDAAGNSSSVSQSVTLNSTARVTLNPVTTPTQQTTQTLKGTKDNDVTVKVCKYDSTAPTCSSVCSTPVCTVAAGSTSWTCSNVALIEGGNNFAIIGTDSMSNCNDTIRATIVVDQTPPAVTIDNKNLIPTRTNKKNLPLGGTKSADANLTITGVEAVSGITYTTETSWQATVTLSEGNHAITVTATDAAGNSATDDVTVELDTTLVYDVTFPASPTKIAAQTVSGSRDGNVTISVIHNNNAVCLINGSPGTPSSDWSCSLTLTEGNNTIELRANDELGNSASELKTVVLDATGPSVTIDPTPSTTNDATLLISGYRSDGTIGITGVNTLTVNYPTETTWQSEVTLAEGENTIVVIATDSLGNSGTPVSRLVSLNTQGALTIDPIGSPTGNATPALGGDCVNGAAITLALNSAAQGSCSQTCAGNRWSCGVTLQSGANSITVTSVNGPSTLTASMSLELDQTPPSPVYFLALDTLEGRQIKLDWSTWASAFASQQGVVRYLVYAERSPFTSVTGLSPFRELSVGTNTLLADGLTPDTVYYFAVVAMDNAGNSMSNVTPAENIPTAQGIDGYITDSLTGAPLHNATITINSFPLFQPSAGADGSAYYLKSGLFFGPYQVTVTGNGYVPQTFSNVQVDCGKLTRLDVALAPDLGSGSPSTPAVITAVAGDAEIMVSWKAVNWASLAGYNLYRSTDGANFTLVNTGGPIMNAPDPSGTITYADSGLNNGTLYYYFVRSVSMGGTESGNSAIASATPVAGPPQPPTDLTAVANTDKTITLTWGASPSSGTVTYNVYWDAGDGTIDFGTPLASGISGLTLTTGVLDPATYRFMVSAVKSGLESTNNPAASATITDTAANCRAVITKPRAGRNISGNRVSIHADGSCQNAPYRSEVEFQYRYLDNGSSGWTMIPAAVANHPNPDAAKPYMVHWTTYHPQEKWPVMPDGRYELRAVARAFDSAGNIVFEDSAAPSVEVFIDHHNPDIEESADQLSDHRLSQKVNVNTENSIEFTSAQADDSIEINVPKNAVDDDTVLIAVIPRPSEMADKIDEDKGTDSFLRLNLSSGQKDFETGKEIEITLPYQDDDDDSIVDGTSVPVDDLVLASYNPETDKWENTGITDIKVDKTEKKVSGKTSHFSDFSLVGLGGDSDDDGLSDAFENSIGTDPNDPDTDNDGMPDGWEYSHGLDPLHNDATGNPDNDHLSNLQEFNNGTNPNQYDAAASVTPVPVHGGWWIGIGLLSGLGVIRRRMAAAKK